MIPPLTFEPVYKEKIWGGQALRARLGKALPSTALIGESWELSGYGDDQSRVSGGEFDGGTVSGIAREHHDALLGVRVAGDTLPLLYKFVDASEKLSVQVHPSDEQARKYGWDERGKTECWYIVNADPDARMVVGFKPGVEREDVERAVRDGTLDTLLNEIDIAAGDVLFIPAGTVHAILGGTLLYEVQETSDATLRLYDWGRVDTDGKPRPLHVDESLRVLETPYHEQHRIPPLPLVTGTPAVSCAVRAACRYFVLQEYTFEADSPIELVPRSSFQVLTVVAGETTVSTSGGSCSAELGRTVLVPAESKRATLAATAGARILVSWVPDLAEDVIEPARQSGCPDTAIAALGGHERHNDLLPLLEGSS